MPALNLPTPGTPAPDFSLCDQHGETVSLAQFRGQTVIVYFYPKALTPGCTVQACGLRDSQADFAHHGAVILGISPDPVSRLLKFATQEQLNFRLLSDPDHAVAERYGVWGLKKFMGREYDGIHRISFVIGREGLLRQVFASVKTKTHHRDVLAWLEAHPD
jgi:peroxiredoxin Q/BCP